MKWYQSKFAEHLAEGLFIFLFCLGIGTCSMLCNAKFEITKPKTEKVEKVENERNL